MSSAGQGFTRKKVGRDRNRARNVSDLCKPAVIAREGDRPKGFTVGKPPDPFPQGGAGLQTGHCPWVLDAGPAGRGKEAALRLVQVVR